MREDIRCIRITLKPGMREAALAWAKEVMRRADEAHAALREEGVSLEAAFLDSLDGRDYLVYVMKGDLKKSRAVAQASVRAIDALHRQFKQDCWENATPLAPMIWLEAA
ncbi:MAG: hypothetical protein EBV03_05880 [Proteobacteria bacterium]|nr:hypothetical protein [Pseudomonadota bacterium]